MIQIKNLRKYYSVGNRKIDVLKDINLEVNQGDMIAIMGRSGSGKSTLLNIMAGLLKAEGGTYFYGNENVNEMSLEQSANFRRKNIGYVVQNSALIDSKNVFDNIALPLRYTKSSKADIDKKVAFVLAALDIKPLQYNSIDTLSGGELQRIAIARALIQNPKLILADEPTGALDEQTEIEVLSLFKELNQQGKTIIIVTHNQQVAERCHKIYSIKNGELV
ncbi:methionine import ATP-binding protein metN (plasmid) [Paenibacillus polymyxa M1]|uniref:ABC transporter ATP-binding protein n=1 Tax=Paenibacillus polymyxa TaxID=1406 RepID=UPI00021BBB43|nr:ABC transporter ATP-binding protein [Paenibacillus polymyxa]CCC86237.1 methionine import ATP-binding protein metN [Paenibacillus polymyxa M1]